MNRQPITFKASYQRTRRKVGTFPKLIREIKQRNSTIMVEEDVGLIEVVEEDMVVAMVEEEVVVAHSARPDTTSQKSGRNYHMRSVMQFARIGTCMEIAALVVLAKEKEA